MTLTLAPEDAAFRDEVRAFLADQLTPELKLAGSRSWSSNAAAAPMPPSSRSAWTRSAPTRVPLPRILCSPPS